MQIETQQSAKWFHITSMSEAAAERLRRNANETYAGPPVLFRHRYPVSEISHGEVIVLDSMGERCCVGMENGGECRTHPGVTCEPCSPPRAEELFVQARL